MLRIWSLSPTLVRPYNGGVGSNSEGEFAIMCYARVAAGQINAYCRAKWPNDRGAGMASTWCSGSVIDAYDHEGHSTHKYIPADEFTEHLGEPEGAGVYGCWRMKDGSLLLLTCRGPLAWAPPRAEGEDRRAQWGEFA